MPHVVVGRGVMPCQIDGFPEDCARSRPGAIYLRPAASEELTDGELAHIKSVNPELHGKLQVSVAKAKRLPAKIEVEAPMPAPLVVEKMDESLDSGKKKAKSQ